MIHELDSFSSCEEDELISISEGLANSWPANPITINHYNNNNNNNHQQHQPQLPNSKNIKMTKADKTVTRKSRRKRERDRHKKSTSTDDDRPRTATLKRPFILDETLKDKVDMSLTKKEFMMAVKLCSDVAVQRGLPNMRLRAAKNFHSKGVVNSRNLVTSHGSHFPTNGNNKQPGQNRRKSLEHSGKIDSKSETSSSGASPYMVASKIKKRFPAESPNIRPITSRLERPTLTGFDLPHIHMPPAQQQQQQRQKPPQPPQPAHLITNKLSRQLKLRGRIRRSSSITSLHDHVAKSNNNNNNEGDEDLLKKVVSRPATTISRVLQSNKSRVELSKPEKVPEPCRSCGRNDLPERFHTHGPSLDHPGSKIPIRLETSPKKVVGSSEIGAKKGSTGSSSDSPDSTSKNVEPPKNGSESPKKILLSPKKSGPPKPWLSPKMFRARLPSKEQRSRSLSVDNNSHQKVGLKPIPNRKRRDSKTGFEHGDQMFLMEDDGEVSAGSTSDSEVVVVVNQIRKSQMKEREKKNNKIAAAVATNRRKLAANNEDERMSLDDSDPATSSSTESSNNNNNNKKHIAESKQKKDKIEKVEKIEKNLQSKTIESPTQKLDVDKSAETESESSPVSRTVTVDCSLCGKQFGRNSIQFHQRQCQRRQQVLKGKQEQEQLEERRQSNYIIEEDVAVLPFNEEFDTIWEAHMQLLIPCTKCSRKFFPDRIQVHQRSCKGPIGGVKPPTQPQQQQQPATTLTPAEAMANVEILLSTPLAIRRQLHSQTDAVQVKVSSHPNPEDIDKSQSE